MVRGSALSVGVLRVRTSSVLCLLVHRPALLLSPPSPPQLWGSNMVTDVQLALFANILGVTLFLLVVLYHYIAANNPKKKEE